MSISTQWKRNVILIITMFALLLSMLSPALAAFADYDEAKRDFENKASEYLKEAEEARDIIKILEKDAKDNPNPDRNTINFVMKRLLYPGVYVNDVRDGIVASDIEKDKDEILYNGKYACHPNSPKNLIDHNCNIPNFTTGLIQGIVDPFMTPFTNAEKTSSYSDFGLGVPADIPGGIVPIDPASRTNTYTALELYGYNLKLTSYNGEWDNIVVSNSARMLSNFGLIDRITLVGTTLWNGVKSGVSEYIDNFSFNPVRWFGNIARSFETGASAGINTVIDTSELNIVATNAWKRPSFDKTLYNIYVMTDAEVIRETARNYFAIFSEEFKNRANENETLNEVLSLNPDTALTGIEFVYNPQWETDESIAARQAAEAQRANDIAHNDNELYKQHLHASYTNDPYTPNLVSVTEVPEPVYYTESEQLGFWEEDPQVAAVLGAARNNNLILGSAEDYTTYDEMIADWEQSYTPYFERNFDALGETVTEILEANDASVFMKYPHLDPKQGISKYACANSDGSIMRKEDGTVVYLYEKHNEGSQEFLNSACNTQARPPIGAGLMGNGWDSPVIDDTRHISNVAENGSAMHQINNTIVSFIRSINSFAAKITNVILDLSFSPLLERLGVDEIVAKLVEGFRDTVFFPLATLMAALGALLLFFQILKTGSAWQLLTSFAIILFIFIAGTAFLLHPTATVNLIDKVPAKVDSIIADTILTEDDGSSYCSTGGASNGIRTAQCNVWGAMVFEPWVHLQFGTGYNNLYAKGKAPAGGNEMQNNNTSLVGDAAVNMGGGHIVNNWALYQLDKTKSGTINAHAPKDFLGVVDKDMYRLVDLQAGPNYGANSDTRYFDSWSGKDNGGFTVLLTLIQAILMAIAISLLGAAKIEASFMFSISIIFLPFMLLYSLLPNGRFKLQGYLANLISLLLRRVVIAAMLAVLLKVITVAYSHSDSLETGAFIAIFVSLAFIMYRKELLDLISSNEIGKEMIGNNPEQLKQAAIDAIPQNIKQGYSVMKANVKGATAGFVGGAIGTAEQKFNIRLKRAGIAAQLRNLEKKDELSDAEKRKLERLKQEADDLDYAIANQKKMSSDDIEKLMKESDEINKKIAQLELEIQKLIHEDENANKDEIHKMYQEIQSYEDRQKEISILAAGGARKGSGVLSQAFEGANHSQMVIGRMAERRIRSQSFAPLTALRDVKEAVYTEGADKITDLKEIVEYDTYKEILSNTKNNTTKNSAKKLYGREQGELRKDPALQRKIRELADEKRKRTKEEDYSSALLTENDVKELEKAAQIVDRRRQIEQAKLVATGRPFKAAEIHNQDMNRRIEGLEQVAKSDVIKQQIDDYIEKGGLPRIDESGKTVVRDEYIQKELDKEEKTQKYREKYGKEMTKIENEKHKLQQKILDDMKEKKKEFDIKNEEDGNNDN